MKIAASLLVVLMACTGKSNIAPSPHEEKARIVERQCDLRSGSQQFVDNEVRVLTTPPMAYGKVGCIIAEMQKQGLVGRVGLISEPPTELEAN